MKKVLLVIIFISFAFAFFLPTVSVFAQGGGPEPSTTGEILPPFKTGSDINNLTDLINFILNNIVLPIGSIIAVFFLIYAGFLFVTAGGSEEKLATAKKTFLWTIVGVAILLGSVAISNGIKETVCQIADVPGLGCPAGTE